MGVEYLSSVPSRIGRTGHEQSRYPTSWAMPTLSIWLGGPVSTSGLVFTNKVGGPIRRTTFSDMWQLAAGPLGIPRGDGFHVLRHFYASLLIGHGESVKVVQERLGHSSAQMTLDVYSYLWPDSDDSTRAVVDAILGNSAVLDMCHGTSA
jgi:integrase